MDKEKVLRWFDSDVDFLVTKVLRQHWYKQKYSYLNTPRPDYGLMLLVSGSIDFITEHGTISARTGNLVFYPSIPGMRPFSQTKSMIISFALMLTKRGVCHSHR